MLDSLPKRTGLAIFSDPRAVESHQVRLVIAEKNVTVDILDADPAELPEDVVDVNPYGSLPTLIDRELALYFPRVVVEYLDERFPHPPLMPIDPVERAHKRLLMQRVQVDWYSPVRVIQNNPPRMATKARDLLRDRLTAAAAIFAAKPFYMSDELTLVDCAIAPLLWRLDSLKIKLPKQAKPVLDYADILFARPAFQESLTELEREMHS